MTPPRGTSETASAGPAAPGERRGTISCVVDTDPRFHLDVLRWFACLTRVAGVRPDDLVVHAVGEDATGPLRHLRARGVRVRRIEPFDRRSPHCNKIAGALALAAGEGVVVLTDADVAILEDPRALATAPRSLALKPVGAPNPPLEVLERVFAAAGLPRPPLVALDWLAGEATLAGNGNGGLYLLTASLLAEVAEAWAAWASWLLDRVELLDAWQVHVDQVALALALAATGIEPVRLDPRWNLQINIAERIPADQPQPAVVHYHDRLDPGGLVQPVGKPHVDRAIRLANEAIAAEWRQAFPNETFWDCRYRTNPELGSGVGSRGKALEAKRRLLESVVDSLRPTSVLDVGCGDGRATHGLELPAYVGLDVSSQAVALARATRPDGDYRVGTLAELELAADLVICLDVLIHQPALGEYESLVGRLLAAAGRALVVSGYERPPTSGSPIVYFHEPLSTTIARLAPEARLTPLRREHEITTFLVLQPGAVVERMPSAPPSVRPRPFRARPRRLASRSRALATDLAFALAPRPATRAVVVLGMHRSGTSAMTRIVNLLGVPVGREDDLIQADGANARGYWESLSLTRFQDALLARLGGRWDDPPPLEPGWERRLDLVREVGRARRIVRRVYGDLPVWAWKDPRTSLTLPFWRRTLRRDPIAVVLHRHPLEVARSLAARDGFSKRRSLALWERYNRELLANVAGLPVLVVAYERLVDDPLGVAASARAFLAANGVPVRGVPEEEIRGFVDRSLRHSRFDELDLGADPDVSDEQQDVFRLLHSLEGPHDAFAGLAAGPAGSAARAAHAAS